MHSSHIKFFNFKDLYTLLGMLARSGFIELPFLYHFSDVFHKSSNEKNRMCEVCTFIIIIMPYVHIASAINLTRKIFDELHIHKN